MNQANETLIVFDERFLGHDTGMGHPESPARLRAVVDHLRQANLPRARWSTARPVTADELSMVHARSHIETLAAYAGGRAELDADTSMSPGSWIAASLAAGAAIHAVDELVAGRAANAFVLARPPGHHAEANRAMGFCLLNNAALAAEAARRRGIERVAVLDWDVHHGNGTQHLFEERRDVLYISTHQFPFYPGTGSPDEVGHGAGAGFTVNCALPPGQTDADYRTVFADVVLPSLERFRPELLVVSAGFDAHARDPLGDMALTERGFAAMCSAVASVCPKLVLLLEGGYDLSALSSSVHACIDVLMGGRETFAEAAGTSPESAAAIRETKAAHAAIGAVLVG